MQRDAERSGNHPQRFEDAHQAGGRDGAHADEAHIIAVDVGGRHVRNGHGGRIHRGVAHVAADEPDHGDEHEIHQNAAGAKDQGNAQPHHVAQAEDEADGVEIEDHAPALGQCPDRGHELEVQVLLPDVERAGQEVVNRGDDRGLNQQSGLGAALLAGHQHFRDRRGLRKGQLAVHFAYKVAPQRNEEEDAKAAAAQADENGLQRMRVEVENVERRHGEDGARHHAARRASHAGDDHVLEHRGAPPVDARQADGEDRDGNRRLHSLPDLEGGISRGDAEEDTEQGTPQHRAPGRLRGRRAGGHQRHIDFAVLQRLVRLFRKRLGFDFGHKRAS